MKRNEIQGPGKLIIVHKWTIRNLVSEVDVTVREISGTPAVDGGPDVLGCRHNDHGDDQEDDSEMMVQPVNYIVIVELVRLEHLSNRVHQTFHLLRTL